MSFSRRPDPRFNRGRISVAAGGGGFDPSALVSSLQALNTWTIMSIGDANSMSTDYIAGNTWVDVGTPGVANDSTLGGHRVVSSAGGTAYRTNPYNPPSTTTPTYRVAVVRSDSWAASRCAYALGTANRRGLLGSAMPVRYKQSGNTATGPDIDLPEGKWYIVEEYYDGANTTSFVRIGGIEVTGVSVAAIDVGSLGLFASNTGTQPASASCAFYAEGALPANRAAVRSALLDYFGSANFASRSKTCRWNIRGDSQTRHDVSYDYEGWRKRLFDDCDQTLGYPTYGCGLAGNGNWRNPRHSGVSGDTIENCTTAINAEMGSGGTMAGAGAIDLCVLCIGAANLINGESAAVVLPKLETCYQAVLTREPNAVLVVASPAPFLGNPVQFSDTAAGIPAVVTTLQAANPGRTIDYVDIFTALGGSYNASLYIDDRHLNRQGSYTIAGAALSAVVAPRVAVITT